MTPVITEDKTAKTCGLTTVSQGVPYTSRKYPNLRAPSGLSGLSQCIRPHVEIFFRHSLREALCLSLRALASFEMLQARVNYFFNAMQFGAPRVFCVIEPLVDCIEPSIHVRAQIAQAGVVDKNSHKNRDRRNTNRKCDLNGLIGHRCLQNTLSAISLASSLKTSSELRPQAAVFS